MAIDVEKLREMDAGQLETEERSLREEIWKLRLQVTIGQLQNPRAVRVKRRDLARVLTVRREQQKKIEQGGTR